MKLYLLEWIGDEDYDCMASCVVRAESESQARSIAQNQHGDEIYMNPRRSWEDADHARCTLLTHKGESGMICRDFRAG